MCDYMMIWCNITILCMYHIIYVCKYKVLTVAHAIPSAHDGARACQHATQTQGMLRFLCSSSPALVWYHLRLESKNITEIIAC